MKEIWQEIVARFQRGDILTRLIFINVGAFIAMLLFQVIYALITGNSAESGQGLFNAIFGLPTNDIYRFLTQPYTLITHMFIHGGFYHILMNMMILYFLGKIFLNYFSSKQFFGLYLLSGLLSGGILLLITAASPYFHMQIPAVGASAAIMGIVAGITLYAPNTTVRLFGILPVKLMWIGIATVLLDLMNFQDGNAAGHLGHLIGAGIGFWFAASFKQGKDITKGINKILDSISGWFQKKPKMKVVYSQEKVRKMTDEEYNAHQKVTQSEVDAILDKISASGYSSLTKREKDILFHYSNKK